MNKVNKFSNIYHNCTTTTISIAHIMIEHRPRQQPILAAQKWINDPANGDNYIRMVDAGESEIIDSIQEIDLSPYVETTYKVGDYVLRRYPRSR